MFLGGAARPAMIEKRIFSNILSLIFVVLSEVPVRLQRSRVFARLIDFGMIHSYRTVMALQP
jgi:hypothetical protein